MNDITLEQADQNRLYIEEEELYRSIPARIRHDDVTLADETLRKLLRVQGAMLQVEKDWIEEIPDDIDPLTMRMVYLKKMLSSFNFTYMENLPEANNRFLLDQAVPIFRGKAQLDFIAEVLVGFFGIEVTVWEGNSFEWLWNYTSGYAFTVDSTVTVILTQGTTDHSHDINLNSNQVKRITSGAISYIELYCEAWSVDGHRHLIKVLHRAGADEFEIIAISNHTQATYTHPTVSNWAFTSDLIRVYDGPGWFSGDMCWGSDILDITIFLAYTGPRLADELVRSTEELISKLVPIRAHTYLGQKKANHTGTIYFSPHYKYRHGDATPILYTEKLEWLPETLTAPIFTLRPGYIPNIHDINDVIDVEELQTIGDVVIAGVFTRYPEVRGPFKYMITYNQGATFEMTFTANFDHNFTLSLWFFMDILPSAEEIFLIVGQPSNKMLEFSASSVNDNRFDLKCTLHYADTTTQIVTIAQLKRDQLTNLIVTTTGSSSIDFYIEGVLIQSVILTKPLQEVNGFKSICPSDGSFGIATLQFAKCFLTTADVGNKYDLEIINANSYSVCNLPQKIVDRKLWLRAITFDYYSDRPDVIAIVKINKVSAIIVAGIEYQFANAFYAIDFELVVALETLITKLRFTIPGRPTVYREGSTIFGGKRGEYVEPHSAGLLKIPHSKGKLPTIGDIVNIRSNWTEIWSYVPDRSLPITTLTRDADYSYLRLGNYVGAHEIGPAQLAVTIVATDREKFLLPIASQYTGGASEEAEAVRVEDAKSPFLYAFTFNEGGEVLAQSSWLWDQDGQVTEEQQGPTWFNEVYWSSGMIPFIADSTVHDVELQDYPWAINIWLIVRSVSYNLSGILKSDIFGKWGSVGAEHSYRMYVQNGDLVLELSLLGRSNVSIVVPKAQYAPDEYFKLTYTCDGEYILAYIDENVVPAASVAYDGRTNVDDTVPLAIGVGADSPFSGRIGMLQIVGYCPTTTEREEAYINENSLREHNG